MNAENINNKNLYLGPEYENLPYEDPQEFERLIVRCADHLKFLERLRNIPEEKIEPVMTLSAANQEKEYNDYLDALAQQEREAEERRLADEEELWRSIFIY